MTHLARLSRSGGSAPQAISPMPTRHALAAAANALANYHPDVAELLRRLADRPRPGERRAETIAALQARDRLLQAAAARHFGNLSPAAAARALHAALARYKSGAWTRERTLAEPPDRRAGSIEADCHAILRARDYVLSERSIRGALGDLAAS